MPSSNNTVTLTFAGDATQLDRTFKQVQEGAAQTEGGLQKAGEGFKEVGIQARASREILRGVGDVATVAGAELGGAASQAILLTGGVADLGRGLAHVGPAIKEWASSIGAARLSLVTAGAALFTFGLSQEGSLTKVQTYKNGLADLNYALATNVNFVGRAIPGISSLTGWWEKSADAASKAAHATSDDADQLERLAKIHAQFLNTPPDTNPGGDAFVTAMDLQTIGLNSTESYTAPAKTHKSGGGVDKALQAAKRAAEDRLNEWQSVVDKARQIGDGIYSGLTAKLAAGDKGLVLFPGASLLDKLKKQLQDTLHLQKDLALLQKQGLSQDLVTQLAQGGLGSLGAADELLRGGKGEIAAVNKTASAINKSAGLVGNQAMVNAFNANQKPQTLKVDVSGADSDLKKVIRKWLRTDDGFRNDLRLALK